MSLYIYLLIDLQYMDNTCSWLLNLGKCIVSPYCWYFKTYSNGSLKSTLRHRHAFLNDCRFVDVCDLTGTSRNLSGESVGILLEATAALHQTGRAERTAQQDSEQMKG